MKRDIISDIFIGIGFSSITVGALWWFPPVGLIVGGILSVCIAIYFGVRDAGNSTPT